MAAPDKFQATDKVAVTVRVSPDGTGTPWLDDVQSGSDALQNLAHMALKNCFVPVLVELQKKLDSAPPGLFFRLLHAPSCRGSN